MNEWKKQFEKYTLDRAREHYLNKRVLDYEEKKNGCDAAVLDRGRHIASVRLREDGSLRMSCDCPVARGGKNCVHMAAALYAMEAKEAAAKERLEEDALMEKWRKQDEEARREEERQKNAALETKTRRRQKSQTTAGGKAKAEDAEAQSRAETSSKGRAKVLTETGSKGRAEVLTETSSKDKTKVLAETSSKGRAKVLTETGSKGRAEVLTETSSKGKAKVLTETSSKGRAKVLTETSMEDREKKEAGTEEKSPAAAVDANVKNTKKASAKTRKAAEGGVKTAGRPGRKKASEQAEEKEQSGEQEGARQAGTNNTQKAKEKSLQEKPHQDKKPYQEEKPHQDEKPYQEEKSHQDEKCLKEEREARQLAREERKAKKQAQKEEQKRLAEEALKQELLKRQAEEARREKIREQKAEEAKRRMEKRQKEQEAARKAEEERKKAEEERRQKEAAAEEARKRQEEETLERERRRMLRASRTTADRSEYETLGGAWEEADDAQSGEENKAGVDLLEKYSYFKGNRIKHSSSIPEHIFREGEKLLEQGKIEIRTISAGYGVYYGYSDEVTGRVDARGFHEGDEFPVHIRFDRTKVIDSECGCPKCRRNYYRAFDTPDCPYRAAVLAVLGRYLSEHNFGDATDTKGQNLIAAYQTKRGNLTAVGAEEKKESLKFAPKLIKEGNSLLLTFKVGEKKFFMVKKLDEFCSRVRNGETAVYGSSTSINHKISNFTEKSREWIRFAARLAQEEKTILERSESSYGYSRRREASIGGELELFGWRLDDFYSMAGQDGIEFEDKSYSGKEKNTLYCAEGNPKVTMRISEESFPADKEFHGIKVEGDLPRMFFGMDTAYFISGKNLYRSDKNYVEKIQPLSDLASHNRFSFRVGRNHLAEFYYRILPAIQDVVEVTETEPWKFRSYLPPEVHFVFYLDAEGANVTCGVYAGYGSREVCALDVIDPERQESLEPFRDVVREEWVLKQAMQFLPQVDWELNELHCGGDEMLAYQIMERGARELMELGEVRCTKRFRSNNTVRQVKVAVGVSVSSGLLELTISSEDIPRSELLDILEGYRAKKKYFRMKDGSFVNLEDSSLELLAELMDGAHLKPKDFVKGKMHLPMYRTLYLDKMLEEHEGVYSERDSRFREVVKGFKTVTDADFEEPGSLSKIMRKYQKNGYKWLRTLEAWKFGGILADDMGLGKTLQVISVLLAAKLEGKEGTSLVVVPASVVFNWGEELERFAPELAVSLIVGSQEERQEKIERWEEADVLVTSYDLLKRDIVFYEEKPFLYEVIDEAQYIKNHTTAAAKAVKLINSQIRYALTGTPIENRLSELWSIFDYLMPGFLYGYDVFKREMETPIVKNSDQAATARLQKMVGPFILRRLKGDVLKDLPEKLEECRYVQFEDVQQRLYDAQVLHMRERIAGQDDAEFGRNKMLILAELTRLRQICCDPALCFENYKGQAAKLEACLELIQSAMDGGHRMLVFSQFTSMLGILQNRLDELKIPYYTITGGTSKSKRLQLVQDFNEGNVPVFLISLKAGGVGLNLTGADVVIHYDPWWNQAVQNQATDRAHRMGQTKKVTVYRLIAKDTIEEKIQKLQETKRDLAEQIIGGEMGQLGGLSREELLELLEI